VDHAFRQARRPCSLELRKRLGRFAREARRDFVGARFGGGEQSGPAADRQSVGPAQREAIASAMHFRQGFADLRAMARRRAADPEAVEERHDRRRPFRKPAKRLALAAAHRQGTGDAALGEMLHQADEERQIVLLHALFIERQDIAAALADEEKIRILDAFGDALERLHRAEIVFGEESGERLVGDFGIDRQDRP
jgi:hypothetical protein